MHARQFSYFVAREGEMNGRSGLFVKAVVVVLGIVFFLIYGCGEQKEPTNKTQPSSPYESSEQNEFIQFPGLGVLEVKAQAVEGQVPTVAIRDVDEKVLLQIKMEGKAYGDSEIFTHRVGIQFKVLHIPGLPDPLIMVMAVETWGSDAGWETAIIGVVSGKIKCLWQQTEPLNYDGGIFVGDLGQDIGAGIAQWNFIWGSGEAHVDQHNYRLQLYLWNKEKSQFDVGPHYITKEKGGPSRVPADFGFNFRDQREDFDRLDRN
jgi:hypothetical protein